jgi:valyl-tRNA synthetase
MNISPNKLLPVRLAGSSAMDRARVERLRSYIEKLARIEDIHFIDDSASLRGAATALLGELRILVPLAGLVDVNAEVERLAKQVARSGKDLDSCRRKLENAQFVDNAPPDVVAKERTRAEELGQRIVQLRAQLERLREIQ